MAKSNKPSQAYLGSGRHDWEAISPKPSIYRQVLRLRVPGGWLYSELGTGNPAFVPMPEVVKHKV